MFKKILVANRGEIAMRIIRACRELNIATAAIYPKPTLTGIYVKKADEAYLVGPGPVKGFLDSQQIVSPAQRIGADAIHPGYGFLSENSQFAQLCLNLRHYLYRPIAASHRIDGEQGQSPQSGQTSRYPDRPGVPMAASPTSRAPCRSLKT